MPIKQRCLECDKGYAFPDRLAGKVVECKECGAEIEVDLPDDDLFDDFEHDIPPARKRRQKASSSRRSNHSRGYQSQSSGRDSLPGPIALKLGIALFFGILIAILAIWAPLRTGPPEPASVGTGGLFLLISLVFGVFSYISITRKVTWSKRGRRIEGMWAEFIGYVQLVFCCCLLILGVSEFLSLDAGPVRKNVVAQPNDIARLPNALAQANRGPSVHEIGDSWGKAMLTRSGSWNIATAPPMRPPDFSRSLNFEVVHNGSLVLADQRRRFKKGDGVMAAVKDGEFVHLFGVTSFGDVESFVGLKGIVGDVVGIDLAGTLVVVKDGEDHRCISTETGETVYSEKNAEFIKFNPSGMIIAKVKRDSTQEICLINPRASFDATSIELPSSSIMALDHSHEILVVAEQLGADVELCAFDTDTGTSRGKFKFVKQRITQIAVGYTAVAMALNDDSIVVIDVRLQSGRQARFQPKRPEIAIDEEVKIGQLQLINSERWILINGTLIVDKRSCKVVAKILDPQGNLIARSDVSGNLLRIENNGKWRDPFVLPYHEMNIAFRKLSPGEKVPEYRIARPSDLSQRLPEIAKVVDVSQLQ
ncbi:MAG: hypothetical protein CMJ78_27765 [Planctomycetaceae bacterium]|nr:hypothetical protein [Planctomycetaceae bacterium]